MALDQFFHQGGGQWIYGSAAQVITGKGKTHRHTVLKRYVQIYFHPLHFL